MKIFFLKESWMQNTTHLVYKKCILIIILIVFSLFHCLFALDLPILCHSQDAFNDFQVFCKEFVAMNSLKFRHNNKHNISSHSRHSKSANYNKNYEQEINLSNNYNNFFSLPTIWNCPKKFWSFLLWRNNYLTSNIMTNKTNAINRSRELTRSDENDESNENLSFKQRKHVVIIGLGPIGLITALELIKYSIKHPKSLHITFIEKRMSYTRNIWFDLYPEPYAPTMNVLFDLGLHLIDTDFEKHIQYIDQSKLWTIRCQILEKLLFWYIFEINTNNHHYDNINLLRGYKFEKIVKITKNDLIQYELNNQYKILNYNENEIHFIKFPTHFFISKFTKVDDQMNFLVPFHLIIGTDGYSSQVREKSDSKHLTRESFIVGNQFKYKIFKEDLHQTAILVNLQSIKLPNGKKVCPEPAIDPITNTTISPWRPAFEFNGVLAVFKRLYAPENDGYCQIQILIGNDFEKSLLKNSNINTNTKLWKFVLDVLNYVLKEKLSSINELKKILLNSSSSGTNSNFKSNIQSNSKLNSSDGLIILPIRIKYASPHIMSLNSRQAVILHGDAAVSAHFRLGIGVNNGFRAYYTSEFTQLLNNWIDDKLELDLYSKLSTQRIENMIKYELTTMFFESYCNIYVFPSEEILYFYEKDYNYNDFAPLSLEEALRKCQQRKVQKIEKI